MRPLPLVLAAALLTANVATAQPASSSRPNVLVIISDDAGYGDFSSYGAPDIKTPAIDRLAREGIRLTEFYANGSTCTPTRVGLITGRYQQRYLLEGPLSNPVGAGDQGLRPSGRSLPQLLKGNGYTTALIGKWHLGYTPELQPAAHGFEHFFGFLSGYIDYYTHHSGDGTPDLFENGKPVTVTGYMTDLITQRSIDYIEKHATGSPFFLEVAYNAPHWPYQSPTTPSVAPDNARHVQPTDNPTNSRADYIPIVEHMDAGISQILATLERRGLSRNTLVIFTNDNGGEWLSRNAPFANKKGTLWEGGIRVPAIVRWPGTIPAGRVSDQVAITMDLTATILAATSTAVPPQAGLEGVNLLPMLTGTTTAERTLFWRSQRQRAVRNGDWKLLVDGDTQMLFNLRSDPDEGTNLAAQNPAIVQRLLPLFDQWNQDVTMEASRLPQPQGGRTGRGGGGPGRGGRGTGRGAAPEGTPERQGP